MGEGGAPADAGDRLTQGPRSARFVFAAVFLPLVAIYSLTAQWGLPYHIDPLTNAITGWYLGNEGTVVADHHEVLLEPGYRRNVAWFAESEHGPVSQYPPGAALVAAMVYAVTPGGLEVVRGAGTNDPSQGVVEVPIPPIWPATLSAVLVTAAACGVLAVVFSRMAGGSRTAIPAGLVVGLATGAWSVSSQMSWTHGPAMLAVALALLAVQRERYLLGGLSLGFAILVRPHLAVVASCVGIGLSLLRRDVAPALKIGLGSGAGLAVLVAYNTVVWGAPSISGGYGPQFTERAIGGSATSEGDSFVVNVLRGLFDLDKGLLTWAPFVVVLVIGVAVARRAPAWSVFAALGGVMYLLIQWRANRFSGGGGFFGYRYPLEPLIAAAPLLYAGYLSWVRDRPPARLLLQAGLAVALGGQLVGAAFSVTTG